MKRDLESGCTSPCCRKDAQSAPYILGKVTDGLVKVRFMETGIYVYERLTECLQTRSTLCAKAPDRVRRGQGHAATGPETRDFQAKGLTDMRDAQST